MSSQPIIHATERIEAAEQARNAVHFLFPPDDSSSLLVQKFAELFLSKMHALQEYLGFNPDARFYGMPDAHPLRKEADWNAALPYGGAVRWESGNDSFFPLQAKPNCCGIYVGEIEKPDRKRVDACLQQLFVDPPSAACGSERLQIIPDICSGNHFVNVYHEEEGDRWFAFVHCDTPELKDGDSQRIGLYYDRLNPSLRAIMQRLETPWGSFPYVAGHACSVYLDQCRHANAFANEKRRVIAEYLFGSHRTVFSDTHQGVVPGFGFTLGCYALPKEESPPIPLTVGPEEDAFFVSPTNGSLDDKWNILPHGTGVLFPEISEVYNAFYDREEKAVYATILHNEGVQTIDGVASFSRTFKTERGVERLVEEGEVRNCRRLSFEFGISGTGKG